MATAASRVDDERMTALAEIERLEREQDHDMRAILGLMERMRKRKKVLAVYVSRATGTTLLTLPQRRDEALPHVDSWRLD